MRATIWIGETVMIGGILAAEAAPATPVSEADTKRARQALELHYIDRGIYSPVRCEAENGGEDEKRTWLFCYSVGGSGKIGGLYVAAYDANGATNIFAVNGKAIQHIGRDGEIILHDENMGQIPAMRWRGPMLDIPAALALF